MKNLNFHKRDEPFSLVEWLELMRRQGHEKILVYPQSLPPGMTRVMEHYEAEGFVETRPFSYPAELPDGDEGWIGMKIEHDGLYRKGDGMKGWQIGVG